jgi:hypothetical protein
MAEANWDEVGRNFSELAHELRKTWTEGRSDDKTTADLKDAGAKVKAALDDVEEAINRAVRSPDVRVATKQATSSVAEALGTTLHQVTEWIAHTPAKGSPEESDTPDDDDDKPEHGTIAP